MFMRDLLGEKARDIFRCKGVLSIKVRRWAGGWAGGWAGRGGAGKGEQCICSCCCVGECALAHGLPGAGGCAHLLRG